MKKNISLSLVVFLMDRITKILIISFLKEEQTIPIINNFFSITFAKNTGIAFSLLDGKKYLIISITILIIFILIKLLKKSKNTLESISYCLILGGAVGNLIDRSLYGYVIDFLDFKIVAYHYPTFNIADTSIVIAMFLLLISTKKGENNYENKSRRNK